MNTTKKQPLIPSSKNQFYAILRARIVLAGGAEMSNEVLGDHTLDRLLDVLIPNGIILVPHQTETLDFNKELELLHL